MRRLVLLFLLVPVFMSTCFADDANVLAAESYGVEDVNEAVPDTVSDTVGKLESGRADRLNDALKRVWESFLSAAAGRLRAEIRPALSVVAIAFLCAECSALCADRFSSELVDVAACCAVAFLTLGSTKSIFDTAGDALVRLSDYSSAALPVLFTAAAAGGAASSAAGRYGAVCLALDVMMNAFSRLIIPLVCAYLALSVACCVLENSFLLSAARFTKQLAVTVMTAMTIAFSAYLGVTGIVGGSVDAAAVRTAKTVISTSLPVVGGILSDAAATVLSAASVVKSTVGAFSLIVVCALCVEPFARLGVKMIVFRLTAAIAGMTPSAKLSRFLNDIGTAMGMLTGMVGCCAILLFVSFVSGMKAVTG